jgi:hypothetical protein
VPGHHPNEWRGGKRPITPETAALLCDVLELPGEETREWCAIALIESAKEEKRPRLLRALFGWWVHGVVGTLVALLQTTPAPATANTIPSALRRNGIETVQVVDLTGLKRTECTLSRL